MATTIQLEPYAREGKKFIKLAGKPDSLPHETLQSIPGCRWDERAQAWIVERSTESLSEVFRAFHRKAWVNVDGLVGE